MNEIFSEREVEILKALAEGLSNHEIADKLFLAPNTVKWYVRQLNSKLDTNNRDEIVEVAQSLGLLNGEKPLLQVKHNIPYQSSPFVGRDAELDELHSLLNKPELRLLTILAQGGMGKTRIAVEAAQQQINHFQHGVYFVPLQPLSDVSQIVPQIASSIGYQFQADNTGDREQLLTFLSNKKMLLLIDNWEHLLEGTDIINEILLAAPHIKILATSREKLNLSGETVYVLRGMQFPSWESPSDALEYDALRLLLQAARRCKPDFEVTQDNLDTISRICRLTEGMPLGILLAVAWLDVLSLQEIAEEIQKSADFLETGMRDVPERQRSIRAIFDTAWKHLEPQEQQVFMKMAVFRGGCTRQAAESITGANLRSLQSLVNKALIIRRKDERFEIHELLRQFAENELLNSAQAENVKAAHASYYAQAMQSLESSIMGDRQIEALRDIELDFENIRAAWHWALNKANWQNLSHILRSLYFFAAWKGRWFECRALFEQAITACSAAGYDEEAFVWAQLFIRLARVSTNTSELEKVIEILHRAEDGFEIAFGLRTLAFRHDYAGDPERAWQSCEEALSVARLNHDKYNQIELLMIMSYLAIGRMNKPALGGEVISQALQLAREINNPALIGHTLHHYGVFSLVSLDYESAQKAYEEVLILWQQIGSIAMVASSLKVLVNLHLTLGNFELAESYAQQGIEQASYSNDKLMIWSSQGSLAQIRMYQGRYTEALRLIEEIYQLFDSSEPDYIAEKNTRYAEIYCGMGDYEKAAELFYAAFPEILKAYHNFELVYAAFHFACILNYHENLPEYALELLSFMSESPFASFWNSYHLVPKLMNVLQNSITPERYALIWEAGKTINLRERIKEILEEVVLKEKPDAV